MKGYSHSTKLPGIGVVRMAGTHSGLLRISLGGTARSFIEKLPSGYDWIRSMDPFRGLITKLEKLSRGESVSFNEAIDISSGTDFQQRVWRGIKGIPCGKTLSYLDLAKAVGKPNACRAVANACGANPLPLVIPCHRVVSSDGTIGGFSSGLPLKKRLLRLEGLCFV
jgi:methylated-DNA-[protein]-cysteine S-methyltransferase